MPNYRKDSDAISTLSPEQYRVTQLAATERPGSGEYLHNTEPGIYVKVRPKGFEPLTTWFEARATRSETSRSNP